MSEHQPYLGICFYGKKLYYAISGEENQELKHIGCLDFGFNVEEAVQQMSKEYFPGVYDSIKNLREKFQARHIRILTNPQNECWTTLPKSVYDVPDEREAYLDIIMKGIPRNAIEPVWFPISNTDYKLLSIRNKRTLSGFEKLADHGHSADFCSDFELGNFWVKNSGKKNSFLMLSCYDSLLSVSSFLFGKLRAATYIKFDDVSDLPYFWLQQKNNLSWLSGLHDSILLFGNRSNEIHQHLEPFLDEKTKFISLDSLAKMNVKATEETYGFNLKEAFPAIMLATD